MLGTFIITLRETLEAALIVGILITYLKKIGQSQNIKYIYGGVILAIIASMAFGYFSGVISLIFRDTGEEIFDALILLSAVIVLTYMVIWMHHNAREIKGEIQAKVDQAVSTKRLWALGLLAFVGVFREGVETVLFLWVLTLQGGVMGGINSPLAGGVAGVFIAIFLVWLFFKGFGHLDLRLFFRISGILLIFIAAGMVSSFARKLISIEALPAIIDQVWDTSWLIDERNFIGSLFAGLIGYKSRPSLLELLVYLLYFPLVVILLKRERHDLAQ